MLKALPPGLTARLRTVAMTYSLEQYLGHDLPAIQEWEVAACASDEDGLGLETSGATSSVEAAVNLLAPWGKACFVGLGSRVQFDMFDVLRRQVTVLVPWTLSTVQQARCAAFIVEHDLPIDSLYSHSWRLDQAQEAYEWFDLQNAGKGVFEF